MRAPHTLDGATMLAAIPAQVCSSNLRRESIAIEAPWLPAKIWPGTATGLIVIQIERPGRDRRSGAVNWPGASVQLRASKSQARTALPLLEFTVYT